jgi:hypothetical protein
MLKKQLFLYLKVLVYERPLLLTTVLLLTMLFYLTIGSYRYWTKGPFDLHDRWTEIQYFVRGVDPFDVETGKTSAIYNVGKVSEFGGYTPWSYLLAIPLVPPLPYIVVKYWYFGVMLFSFFLTFFLLYRYFKRLGLPSDKSLLICATALCNWVLVYGMRWGQYSLPVLAALTVYMIAVARNRPILGGISLAFALIKPQVALLFGFVAFAKKQFKLIFVASVALIASWIVAAVWLGKPALSLIMAKARQNVGKGYYYGIFDAIIRNSQEREFWLLLSGILFIAIMTLISLLQSRKDVEYHMAIAAVASTMWTYSGVYDSLVLAFMICYLFLQYHSQPGNDRGLVLLILAAILVWQPSGILHGIIWPLPLIMRAVWILAIVSAVKSEKCAALL